MLHTRLPVRQGISISARPPASLPRWAKPPLSGSWDQFSRNSHAALDALIAAISAHLRKQDHIPDRALVFGSFVEILRSCPNIPPGSAWIRSSAPAPPASAPSVPPAPRAHPPPARKTPQRGQPRTRVLRLQQPIQHLRRRFHRLIVYQDAAFISRLARISMPVPSASFTTTAPIVTGALSSTSCSAVSSSRMRGLGKGLAV